NRILVRSRRSEVAGRAGRREQDPCRTGTVELRSVLCDVGDTERHVGREGEFAGNSRTADIGCETCTQGLDGRETIEILQTVRRESEGSGVAGIAEGAAWRRSDESASRGKIERAGGEAEIRK